MAAFSTIALAAIAAGSAYYSGAEAQKNQLSADDRRENAEKFANEQIDGERARKKRLEEQKAQTIILANQRSLRRSQTGLTTTPRSVTVGSPTEKIGI